MYSISYVAFFNRFNVLINVSSVYEVDSPLYVWPDVWSADLHLLIFKSMVIHDTECPYWDQVSLNNTNQTCLWSISNIYFKTGCVNRAKIVTLKERHSCQALCSCLKVVHFFYSLWHLDTFLWCHYLWCNLNTRNLYIILFSFAQSTSSLPSEGLFRNLMVILNYKSYTTDLAKEWNKCALSMLDGILRVQYSNILQFNLCFLYVCVF